MVQIKAEKPVIRLWLLDEIGLIILHPTGVWYSNQVGGYACLHPEVEGVFVPLKDDVHGHSQRERLETHFTSSKWKGYCYKGIDEETADFVDEVLQSSLYTKRLSVDRAKLAESNEAWIHVIISSEDRDEELQEFVRFPSGLGILTWNNSD